MNKGAASSEMRDKMKAAVVVAKDNDFSDPKARMNSFLKGAVLGRMSQQKF